MKWPGDEEDVSLGTIIAAPKRISRGPKRFVQKLFVGLPIEHCDETQPKFCKAFLMILRLRQ